MNKTVFRARAITMALISGTLCAQASLNELPLDGDWEFAFMPGLVADVPELPPDAAYDVKVTIPDYLGFQTDRLKEAAWWSLPTDPAPEFAVLKGIGFYRQSVMIPDTWEGKSVRAYVGRAYDRLNIWINSRHVAFHPHAGMTPMMIEISGYLKPGSSNEIILAVDNTTEMEEQYHKYGPSIVEPVRLLAAGGPACIHDVYVRPGSDLHEAAIEVELAVMERLQWQKNMSMEWRIHNVYSRELIGQGAVPVTAAHRKQPLSWSVRREAFQAWHPNSPNLYYLELTWKAGDRVIDRIEQRFGLRRWSSEGRLLQLNGKPIFLRQWYGTSDITHARHPQDKAWWLRFFDLIKSRGYNSIHIYNVAMSGDWLAAADEAGIVVQCPASCHRVMRMKGKEISQMTDLFAEVVRWTRSYPSMCIYCLGGEMPYYDGFIEDVAKNHQIIQTLNPESLLLPNQAMRGIEYSFRAEDKKEKLTQMPFPHHAERLRRITDVSDIFGTAKKYFSYVKLDLPWHTVDSWLTIYERPLIAHEIVMCHRASSSRDLSKFTSLRYGIQNREYLARTYGAPISGKEIRALMAKADATPSEYYNSVNRLNAAMCKYVFEKVRKCGNLAGFQDISGHAGLNQLFMDEDCHGYSATSFRRYNDDNVVLLDFDEGHCRIRTYWMGDDFHGRVMMSLYDGKPLPSALLRWELKDGARTIKWDFIQIGPFEAGSVTTPADIAFTWPEFPENKKLNLSVSVQGFGRRMENDWDFWVFRRLPSSRVQAACSPALLAKWAREFPAWSDITASQSAKLWVLDALNEDAVNHLEQGGNVLLAGAHPFPVYNQWVTFQQGHREWHNSGTIVHPHPIWADIPHEGWGDWQFYHLLQGAAPVIFSGRARREDTTDVDPRMPLMADIPFAPILEVLDRVRLRRQACIFELHVGQGRLLVSTCPDDPDQPARAVLFTALVNYISGPANESAPTVAPETLRRLLRGAPPVVENNAVKFAARMFAGGTMMPRYSAFQIPPRDGIILHPGKDMKAIFNLHANQIPASEDNALILTVDGQDCDPLGPTGMRILLNDIVIYDGTNQCVKKGWSSWSVPVPKDLVREGQNTLAFHNTEDPSHSIQWFMLAEAILAGPATAKSLTAAAECNVDWRRAPFTLAWERKQWCRIDGRGWKETDTLSFDRQGRWRVEIKKTLEDAQAEIAEIGLDITSPRLALRSNPPVEQVAGEYFATPKTEFALDAQDAMSGVRTVEIAIDDRDFKPYAGAFYLPAGRHSIRARVTDRAGNQTTVFTGGLEGAGIMECIQIQIK